MTFDMGSTAAVPATSSNLVAPPAEVLASEEEASTAIAIPDAAKSKALTMANGFVGQLLDLEPKSPDFTRKLEDLSSLGQSEVVKASSTSNSILDRRPTMRKAQDGVNANLTDLRNLIVELDPNRTDFDGVKRILKFVPGSKYISRYFAQYETAQSKLNDIVNAIKAGQDDLRKDNAAIEIERRNLWALMGDLRGYIELAAQLDELLVDKIAEVRFAGQEETAQALEAEALFAVRQRRQALVTSLAASMQNYMALILLQRANKELRRACDNATTTTIGVLKTAVITSEALDRQKLVLNQIEALNTVTGDMMVANAERLKTQGLAIQKQAAEAAIPAEKLAAAFDNITTALDEWDAFRIAANDSINTTLDAMQAQIERARPYVERAGSPEN